MPTQPPVPPAARSPYGPEGVPKTAEDVSHRVRHAAERHERTADAAPPSRADAEGARGPNPWPLLAGVALAAYVLGALIHRR